MEVDGFDENDTKRILENEENLQPPFKSDKKCVNIDSDSDEDNLRICGNNTIIQRVLDKSVTTIDSVNEEAGVEVESDTENDEIISKPTNSLKKSRKYYFNSDSENDEEVNPHDKSFHDENRQTLNIINSNSSSLNCNDNKNDYKTDDDENIDNSSAETVRPIKYRKSTKNKEGNKMTGHEAAQQRLEIQSESQRMAREASINLPYHKPKSYSIQEFLQKRSKLIAPHVPNVAPSLALKLMKNQLKEISQQVAEGLKQVEEFYKSESSEEENEEEKEKLNGEFVARIVNDIFDNAMDLVEKETVIVETVVEEYVKKGETLQIDTMASYPLEKYMENDGKSVQSSIMKELMKKLGTIQPKLSGGPDDIIDLDMGITRPSDVKQLVDKWFKHSLKRAPLTQDTQLKVMGVTSAGEIIEEAIPIKIEEEEDKRAIIEIPGAKIHKLRTELQAQMAQKREETWRQKQEKGECVLVTNLHDGEKVECDMNDHYLDDEDEEEMEITDEECEEEEEEPEENDINMSEKLKTKNLLIDDEADETDVESNDEENNEIEEETNTIIEMTVKKPLKRIIQQFDSDSDNDELPLANSRFLVKTPQRSEQSSKDLGFLTPLTCLTGLKQKTNEKSDLADQSWEQDKAKATVQKNLFNTSEFYEEKSSAKKEFVQISFPKSQEDTVPFVKSQEENCTQDLLDICTGGFTGTPRIEILTNVVITPAAENSEIKNVHKIDSDIISQLLLDEEEMEKFKKKFESPIAQSSSQIDDLSVDEVNATGLIDSDDESDILKVQKLNRKRQHKLLFSDDEEEDDNVEKLSDFDEHESEIKAKIDEVDYDSEENEVTQKEMFKVSDFVEAEAELSESEWGSADEDENDLDKLELEECDNEDIDHTKVRQDLERIHMRQLLDDDNREVKLLQELLLEDGELHGAGRQRQFRWKNIDSKGDENEVNGTKKEDDCYFDDEEETEEQFRKMRMKREMFLKQHSQKEENLASVLDNSTVLKIGKVVLNSSLTASIKTGPSVSIKKNECSSLMSKRGSFLARGDQVLQRLSYYSKSPTNTSTTGINVKNSRGFVFQTLDKAETSASTASTFGVKRKTVEGTPTAIKKLRLNNMSPGVSEKDKNSKSSKSKNCFTTRLF